MTNTNKSLRISQLSVYERAKAYVTFWLELKFPKWAILGERVKGTLEAGVVFVFMLKIPLNLQLRMENIQY